LLARLQGGIVDSDWDSVPKGLFPSYKPFIEYNEKWGKVGMQRPNMA